jgi:hypothetical protein
MSRNASNNAGKTRGKPFKPGNPGGPGRRAGSRNKATLALDKMAEDDAKDIARKLLDAAKAGDMRAAELVLARVWPVRKGRPITLDLPPIDTAADVVKALGFIASAVGAGEVTPEEGTALAGVLEIKRKAMETSELEARIAALEKERK